MSLVDDHVYVIFEDMQMTEANFTEQPQPLFPEQRAYTANYELSDAEALVYAQVIDDVFNEMNRADRLDGQRRGTRIRR